MQSLRASVRPARLYLPKFFAIFHSAWFAYLTLLAFQLKRIWRVWDWRDLPGGDSCAYFLSAYSWFRHGRLNFGYSPLYTSFWGSLLRVTDDVAAATMLHRVLIILTTAALVLAVLRRILPAGLAWLVAAWWAVLPVNFNTMYEVHLFSLLPLLLAWVALWQRRSAWNRGIAMALLVLSAFLVRNEMSVSAAGFLLLCLVREIRRRRGHDPAAARGAGSTAFAYIVPTAFALAVVGYYYLHSDLRGAALRAQMHAKHVVSIGQAYALGYAERHPDWNRNPWTDFEDACRADFGLPEPTLSDMLHTNPRAVASHVLWNLRLVPHSIQLLLFNRSGGAVNPDVVDMPMKSGAALAGSLAALVLIALALARHKTDLWRRTFRERRFEWLACTVTLAFTVPVALLVRPRPAYLFSVSVGLLAFLAACALVVAGAWPLWRRVRGVMPAIMIALVIVVPGGYGSRKHHGTQPLLTMYERLKPFQRDFVAKDAVYLGARAVELHNYLGYGSGRAIDLQELAALPADETIADFLDRQHVTLLYLDLEWSNAMEALRPGAIDSFLSSAPAEWRVLSAGETRTDWWIVMGRRTPATRGPKLPLEPTPESATETEHECGPTNSIARYPRFLGRLPEMGSSTSLN